MRKIVFFLILLMGFGFVACEQESVDSSDPIYPSPKAVVVNDEACGKNSIALLFDGGAAIKAGAESFTSNLTPEDGGEPLSITREATAADACNHLFTNLPTGVYTASVYATYPDGTTTTPVFVTDSKGAVVKLKIEGASLSVKLAYATSSTLAFTWSVSSFKDIAKDCGTAYSFGIYKDAACKNLVVSWQTDVDDKIWTYLADGAPQFEFSGLDKNTDYWFVVKDLANNAASTPVKAKTLDFEVVVPNEAEMVEPSGIVLAEDFSELVWGANYLRGSAAYSADDRNLATAFDKAEGVNPINGGNWKWYLVDPSIEIGLFSTMKHAVENSRLAQWGLCSEVVGAGNSTICGRVGHIKLGASSKTALMCTPALTNLKSVATIEVQFDQARYDSDPVTGAVYVLNESAHAGKDGGYEVTPTIDKLAPAAEFEIKAGRSFTTEKIVIKNVAPGARIGIGPIRKDGSTPGSSQHRMFMDNVIIKVVAYESSTVALDAPVITSAEATAEEIVVKWESVEKASGYIIEYKESAAEQYTVVEVGNVLEYAIGALKGATVYQIRIKAVEEVSGSESEYSEVKEVKTLAKAEFPMIASNADEFIAILNDADGLRTAVATDEIQLAGNLDFTGKTLPEGVVFPGMLNGKNFTISNLVSDHAMFAQLSGAKDLTIDETCTFAATTATTLAPLAVEATGTISNVVNKANVSVELAADGDATVIVAGLVAINSAAIDKCKNYGAVTYTSTAPAYGGLVAGLAAYSDGAINECENYGNLTSNIPYLSNFGVVKEVTNLPIHIAGLVAQLDVNGSVTKSLNEGNIDYDITAIESMTISCGTNRPRIGGIVGLAYGGITACTNNGALDVNVTTSDQSVYKANNYPVNIGGISGGAFANATGASGADVTDCINNGDIKCVSYCDGAIPTCAGIVGYPGYENAAQTNLITRCVNNGTLEVFAQDEIRVGGINGGTGNVTYCKNYGAIKGTIPYTDATIGGISAFLSQSHKFEYNESYGALSNINGSTGVIEIGGLVGQHGGVNSYEGEGRGCVVNCDIVYDWGNHNWYSLIIGWNYSSSAVVVMGTVDEPIKILGGSMSCDGGTTVIPITAENYETYVKGAGSEAHTVNVQFGN
ncbi:MAG: fibronectin type III domain-containing protein [Alistipes sp.]|nr:fibronectin type III domain-containing protein [Alistipes sp.]